MFGVLRCVFPVCSHATDYAVHPAIQTSPGRQLQLRLKLSDLVRKAGGLRSLPMNQ